jgi:hypothetical protein
MEEYRTSAQSSVTFDLLKAEFSKRYPQHKKQSADKPG